MPAKAGVSRARQYSPHPVPSRPKLQRAAMITRSNTKKEAVTLRERIERYVDACPPAVSGQNGHDQTFRVACILVQGFDLSPDDAYSFLARFNQRCEPSWSERELRHKLCDA